MEISVLYFAGRLESSLKNVLQFPPVLWSVHGAIYKDGRAAEMLSLV